MRLKPCAGLDPLRLADPNAMIALLRCWKPSPFAGFMGAASSQFWFPAFAIKSAKPLTLVEVLFAGVVSGALLKQRLS
jgi:hypothetical protein